MAGVGCSWKRLCALPARNLVSNGVQLARRLSVSARSCSTPWQAPRSAKNSRGLVHSLSARTLVDKLACRAFNSVLESTRVMTYSTQSEVVEKVKEEIENLSPSKVFAVVHISGRQFKFTQNDLIVINRIPADIGEKIILEKVLLAGSEKFTLVGTPLLSKESVRVHATVTEHSRTAKLIVFKKKRRKNYKRKRGHRQDTTVLRINNIQFSSDIQ